MRTLKLQLTAGGHESTRCDMLCNIATTVRQACADLCSTLFSNLHQINRKLSSQCGRSVFEATALVDDLRPDNDSQSSNVYRNRKMMLPKRTVFAAAAFAAVGLFLSLPVTGNDRNTLGSGNEYLAFRLPLWKTSHFDDAAQAEKQFTRLAKFGCETKQDKNNVSYRCTNWRSIQGESPRQSQRWGQWLTTLGFEISHVEIDEAFSRGNEVVEFRMTDWKSIQSDRSKQQQQFVDYLRRLGVEVEVQKHQQHSEIRYRAPTWRNLRFGNRDSADQTKDWLKQQGFEARHSY